MNKLLLFLSLALIAMNVTATANEHYRYECTKDNDIKNIAVLYDSKKSAVPCKVVYAKKDKQETLWHAEMQTGYCEVKAENFANNQITKGWNCQKVNGKIPK